MFVFQPNLRGVSMRVSFTVMMLAVLPGGLCGMAAAQAISLNNSQHIVAFPATPVGAKSTPVNVPLQIKTDGTIIIGITIPLSQGGKQEYAAQGTGCALNTALAAGTVCNVPVVFNPAYSGQRKVALQVTTTDTSFNFGMSGLGTGPQVSLAPAIITTVAGNGKPALTGDGGAATGAGVLEPFATVVDNAGNLYIVDAIDNVIREVAVNTGIISTVAGINGAGGFGGDHGPAVDATLNGPTGVAVDSAGNLYIADSQNDFIRKVTAATGNISTVVGIGHLIMIKGIPPSAPAGYTGDGGLATSAKLDNPAGLAFDSSDNMYIADNLNNVIRKVDSATGIISTVAGNHTKGYSGDGGPAISAELNSPNGVAVDASGNLFIVDTQAIRKVVAATGIITTVAGTGSAGYSGDGGAATAAELDNPTNIAVDSAGNLYIADASNNRIREVNADTGMIATIVGNGTSGFGGDASDSGNAMLREPFGVGLDNSGNIYIADTMNNRIRNVNVLESELYFANTPIGFSSLDSPQVATVTNIGNAPLVFTVPANGINPSISQNFTLSNGSTCPQLDISSSAESLPSGNSCTLLLSFVPIQTGAIAGTADISDNAVSTPPFLQSVHLNGFGLPASAGRPDFNLSVTPSSQTITLGMPATYTVTVSAIYGFAGSVALVSTNAPAGATANFSPASVAVSGTGTSSTFTITIPKTLVTSRPNENHFPGKNSALRYGLLFLVFPLLGIARKQTESHSAARKTLFMVFLMVSLGAAAIGTTGCANIGLELQPQTYNITITGTSGNLQRATTLALTAEGYVKIKYH